MPPKDLSARRHRDDGFVARLQQVVLVEVETDVALPRSAEGAKPRAITDGLATGDPLAVDRQFADRRRGRAIEGEPTDGGMVTCLDRAMDERVAGIQGREALVEQMVGASVDGAVLFHCRRIRSRHFFRDLVFPRVMAVRIGVLDHRLDVQSERFPDYPEALLIALSDADEAEDLQRRRAECTGLPAATVVTGEEFLESSRIPVDAHEVGVMRHQLLPRIPAETQDPGAAEQGSVLAPIEMAAQYPASGPFQFDSEAEKVGVLVHMVPHQLSGVRRTPPVVELAPFGSQQLDCTKPKAGPGGFRDVQEQQARQVLSVVAARNAPPHVNTPAVDASAKRCRGSDRAKY